jgi:hypothetical protein
VAEVGEIDPAERSACSAPVTAARKLREKVESAMLPFEKLKDEKPMISMAIQERARRRGFIDAYMGSLNTSR